MAAMPFFPMPQEHPLYALSGAPHATGASPLKDLIRNLRKNHSKKIEFLRERPLNVPIKYCSQSSALATSTMFHVYWHTTALRIRHVWRDVDWMGSFSRVYLRQAPVASTRYGVGELTSARWHFGAASAAKHVRGHGATQPYG